MHSTDDSGIDSNLKIWRELMLGYETNKWLRMFQLKIFCKNKETHGEKTYHTLSNQGKFIFEAQGYFILAFFRRRDVLLHYRQRHFA